jgi:hypothetical protein
VRTVPLLSGELEDVIRSVREIPGDASREMGKTMRRSAKKVVDEARSRASWSTRIPGALSARVTRASARPGVEITGKVARAPHMRVYEGFIGRGKKATFRAPHFGDRERWYTHKTRPFIVPAVAATAGQFRADVSDAAIEAYKRAGFK